MRWTLRKKILLGYGLTLLLAALVLALALYDLARLGSATDAILSENYRSIRAAEHMINAVERQDSGALLALLGDREEGIRQFRANQNAFSQWLGRAKDNVTIEGEPEVLAAIDATYDDYLIAFTDVLAQDTLPPTRVTYQQTLLPRFQAVRQASARLRNLNQDTMVAASDRAGAIARRAMWSVGLIGLGALALGLVFSLTLSRRLVRPIRQMQTAAGEIAAGHYDVEVEARPSDELGRLADQFNEMARRLEGYRALNVEKIIHEQREKEAILQSIDDGLVVIDAAFDVQSMNPAAARALGVETDTAEGRHFLEVIKSDRLFAYVKETATSGRSPAVDPLESLFSVERDGQEQHYQFLVQPVYMPASAENGGASSKGAGGEIAEMIGVILLLRDVTKLRELDRLKSEFVATASHELKTPLTSIGMSIELLEERAGVLSEEDREVLGVASEEVERLRALVSDLLDLSKIEVGRMEMQSEAVAPSALVGRAAQQFAPQAEKQSVALRRDVPEGLPRVQADAARIGQVLNNLLSNALRHTPAGGTVQLAAEAAGEEVRFRVADTGEGIPPEHLPEIFGKFVQVDGQHSVGGSGLGLAICKEIVEAHGGRITADSAVGEGATFVFTLPVAEAA